MIYVYLNYPNRQATVHHDSTCQHIRQAHKQGQRTAKINLAKISEELGKFADKQYTFASKPSQNDIWLEIDFRDADFEKAVAAYVLRLAGKHYKPFRELGLQTHCQSNGVSVSNVVAQGV